MKKQWMAPQLEDLSVNATQTDEAATYKRPGNGGGHQWGKPNNGKPNQGGNNGGRPNGGGCGCGCGRPGRS